MQNRTDRIRSDRPAAKSCPPERESSWSPCLGPACVEVEPIRSNQQGTPMPRILRRAFEPQEMIWWGATLVVLALILVEHPAAAHHALQALPEQPRAGDLRPRGRRQHGALRARWRQVRVAAVPGLQLLEPGADSDRDSAARRPVDREHPRQRAQRVHGGHRHQPRGDAERGHPPAGSQRRGRCAARPRKSSSASCAR